jgi:hypothetical protein
MVAFAQLVRNVAPSVNKSSGLTTAHTRDRYWNSARGHYVTIMCRDATEFVT